MLGVLVTDLELERSIRGLLAGRLVEYYKLTGIFKETVLVRVLPGACRAK